MQTINVDNLVHSYGTVQALKGLSLTVSPGELFGLVGPDGAGKTTLFKILVTLLKPTQGKAYVLGKEVTNQYRYLREKIGYMPGRFSLYPDLSVEENLQFFAAVFATSISQNYWLIAPIYEQLAPFKHRKAGALSGGMKQKLALCCALIHQPEVLFLDEPTTGVDAVSRKEFWDMLKDLKEYGLTMVVSTPYMDEAARCERIALMQEGQILATDQPAKIAQRFPYPLWAVATATKHTTIQALRQAPITHSCYAFGEHLHWAPLAHTTAETAAAYLKDVPGILSYQPIPPTIEDTFMELITKKQLHEAGSSRP